jgi:hypothetical protein
LAPEAVTNLFLYGQWSRPAALVDEALIRPDQASTTAAVDAVSFVFDGPGRFAHASMSAMQQVGSDVQITADVANSVLLKNVVLANLTQGDFHFV